MTLWFFVLFLFFGVAPTDPLTFTIAVGTLFLVGAVAGWWKALRVTKVLPIIALKCE